ncbi:SWIM zinc finger family protein [Lactiplantibacillus herbarum]|uniref:SWIM zinc finger family protein n=1 Tax=Lactiplantibacillus herbarum TaxID=1670446 RepID=UPI00064EF66A|nr:SWIM zinc finger family protein [Lactiplantibacillus herbarum]
MDWEQLFQSRILNRGFDYYMQGLIENFKMTSKHVSAQVLGSENYQVDIKLQGDHVQVATCDCPYAAEHEYCKHMAAVLYEMDARNEVSQFDDEADTIAALVDRISEREVRAFLSAMLENNQRLAMLFKMTVSPTNETDNLESYQEQINMIFENHIDKYDFIDYDSATPFADELGRFISDDLQNAVNTGQLTMAFEIISQLSLRIDQLEIDDSDGEIMMLLDQCTDVWQGLIDGANMPLKERIFAWLRQQVTGSLNIIEDEVTELLFSNFKEDVFLTAKSDFTAQRLQAAQHTSENWDREWQLDKWAGYHLQVLTERHAADIELRQFCLDNIKINSVRKYYVDFCLQRQDYQTAIEILKAGKSASEYRGVVAEYSLQLKDLYRQLNQQEDCQRELWLLLTVYEPADCELFVEWKQQYPEAEWKIQRERLFDKLAPEPYVDLKPLYAEEHLYNRLLEAVVADNGLQSVRDYEKILKPHYSDQLLQKYVTTIQQLAERPSDRRHYRQLVTILNEMIAYPAGSMTAKQVISDWKQRYPRRTAMMDELTKFKGK